MCPRATEPIHPSDPRVAALGRSSGFRLMKQPEMDMVCLSEDSQPTEQYCPPEFDASEDVGAIVCRRKQEETPQIVCAEGFEDNSGTCKKFDVTKKRILCPEESVLSHGQCIVHLEQAPLTMCPRGFGFTSGMCVKEVMTAPIAECSLTYTYDPLTGRCYKTETEWILANEVPPKTPKIAPEIPEEKLLANKVPTPPPTDGSLGQQQPQPRAPQQITVIQQPIPVPQPQIILPQQAPMPPPPPRPIPVPVMVPMRQPYPMPYEVERPVPVPVPYPVNTKSKQPKLKMPKSKGGYSPYSNMYSNSKKKSKK
eukprot:Lankesteria_metandrocarpae@DN1943_c0_g1_i1.p1